MGSSYQHTAGEEMANIAPWAEENVNKKMLNSLKSAEVVVENTPKRNSATMAAPLSGIARQDSVKWLEVTLTRNLCMRMHIKSVVNSCQRALYALKTVRAHGMPPESLNKVFEAVALGKIRYASSAWFGFSSKADRSFFPEEHEIWFPTAG